MKTPIIIILLLVIANTGFGQKKIDTAIINMPMVDGRLVYSGSAELQDHKRELLDTTGKKWLFNYFKDNNLSDANAKITPSTNDTARLTLRGGLINFQFAPGMIKIDFYAIVNLKFKCVNNKYFYQIDSIYFRPKNEVLNTLGYQNSPEYLIGLYNKKHLGLWTSIFVDRKMIRKYLFNLNLAIQDCIASLNKAMAN